MGIGRIVAAAVLAAAAGLAAPVAAGAQAPAGERALLGRAGGNVLLRADGPHAEAMRDGAGRPPGREVDRASAGARALLGSSGGWRLRVEPAGGGDAAATDAERALLGRWPPSGAGGATAAGEAREGRGEE